MQLKKLIKLFSFIFILSSFPVGIISAQSQVGTFSGNDISSYTCYDRKGDKIESGVLKDDARGVFYCNANGQDGYQPCLGGVYDQGDSCDPQAVLNPPTLQQLEVWFVRIVYAIWAVAGTFSFLGIVAIGYQYMISRGAPEATVKVKDRIAKFIVGFCLVFLAVPILTTIFRVLNVNDSVQCYQGLTSNVGVGFQFFFPTLCTAPNIENAVTSAAICDEISRLYGNGVNILPGQDTGLACNSNSEQSELCGFIIGIRFQCREGTWRSILSR